MNRTAVMIITLVVVAAGVPAAAAIADSSQATQNDGAEPGASFAGVIGVQQAEVDNEVAQRSLSAQFSAAGSNDSKAHLVATESDRLKERLEALKAEKEQLKQARENGSIGQGEYRARLAELAVNLRAVSKQANQTADIAATLPAETLRENGANVSEVRTVAQQASRSGGGEVAEAARSIAGEGAGNGLGNAPNASERGPPEEAENRPDDVGPNRNGTETEGAENGDRPENTTERGQNENGERGQNTTEQGQNTTVSDEKQPSNGAESNQFETETGGVEAGDESAVDNTATDDGLETASTTIAP